MITVTPAGKRRHQVNLVTRDAGGGGSNELCEAILVPATLASGVWALVRPLSSKEVQSNAENSLSVTHEVRVLYSISITDALTHADSVVFGTRTLDIASIINIGEENREWSILCNERQAVAPPRTFIPV